MTSGPFDPLLDCFKKHFPLHFSKFVVWCPGAWTNVTWKILRFACTMHFRHRVVRSPGSKIGGFVITENLRFEKLQNQLPNDSWSFSRPAPILKEVVFSHFCITIIVIFQKWSLKTRHFCNYGSKATVKMDSLGPFRFRRSEQWRMRLFFPLDFDRNGLGIPRHFEAIGNSISCKKLPS